MTVIINLGHSKLVIMKYYRTIDGDASPGQKNHRVLESCCYRRLQHDRCTFPTLAPQVWTSLCLYIDTGVSRVNDHDAGRVVSTWQGRFIADVMAGHQIWRHCIVAWRGIEWTSTQQPGWRALSPSVSGHQDCHWYLYPLFVVFR